MKTYELSCTNETFRYEIRVNCGFWFYCFELKLNSLYNS